jgi:hypothetical protein
MRTARTLTLDQFAGELYKLPQTIEGAIVRGLRSAAARGVPEVVGAINAAKPFPAVFSGQLARSVEHSDLPRGGRISVDAPHAAIMETGTRPFWPPLQPLIDWATYKFGVDEDEAEEIAEAVRFKIAWFGIEPRHYFQTAMRTINQLVPIEVEAELDKL